MKILVVRGGSNSLSTFSHFLEKDKQKYDNEKIVLYFLLLLIKNYDVFRYNIFFNYFYFLFMSKIII